MNSDRNALGVPPAPTFSVAARTYLLEWVPRALREALGGPVTASEDPGEPPAELCREVAGVFVSLHVNGTLRGCIGRLRAQRPLWELTRDMAVSAATRDPRFDAVGLGELAHTEVEVSVLGGLVEVPVAQRKPTAEFLVAGIHGGQLSLGDRRGILLPQVAQKYDWDAPRFLGELSLKADLAEDAWLDPRARLCLFRVETITSAGKRDLG